MKDRYFRERSKWAKVSGAPGKYFVALGWKGNFQAVRVLTTDAQRHAVTIAQDWIGDQ